MGNGISEKQWVGIDLHLHRSVICRIDDAGKQLDCVQIDNDPKTLVKEVRKPAGVHRSPSRRRTAGTGLSTRCRRRSSRCTWRTPTG